MTTFSHDGGMFMNFDNGGYYGGNNNRYNNGNNRYNNGYNNSYNNGYNNYNGNNRSVYDYEAERREAIAAGNRALNSLYAAKNELDRARGWGMADMFGGGFLTTFVKHSKMDNAQRYVEQAKYDLQTFSRELNDVSMHMNINVGSSDFLSFADYFWDGLFADMMVQDKINRARAQVNDAILQVEAILRQLQY